MRESLATLPPEFYRVLGRRTGIVNAVFCSELSRTEPETYLPVPRLTNLEYLFETSREMDLGAGGKGTDFGTSLTRCVGEVIERYCMCWPSSDAITRATYDELAATEPVVDIDYLDVYDRDEHERWLAPFDRETTIPWVAGENLLTGDHVYVPAELVWMSVGKLEDTATHFIGNSNGCAAGQNAASALVNGIFEATERDGFMRNWCTQTTPTGIAIDSYPSIERMASEKLENEAITTHLFQLDSLLDIPTFGSAFTSRVDGTPRFLIGGSSDLDAATAMKDALVEVSQGWAHTRYLATRYDDISTVDASNSVDDFDESMLYYALEENFDDVAFLLEGSKRDYESPTGDETAGWTPERKLEYCLDRLEAADCTPIAFELTTPDIAELGLNVTRVFVPEFVPFTSPAILPEQHPAFDDVEVTEKPHPYP